MGLRLSWKPVRFVERKWRLEINQSLLEESAERKEETVAMEGEEESQKQQQ